MPSLRRRRIADRSILAAWSVAALVWAAAIPLATPALAGVHGPLFSIDVEPDTASAPAGTTFVLRATLYDESDNVFDGAGTDTHIRFIWEDGSPNQQPDMSCDTGSDGTCSVSYQADDPGEDAI